MTMTITRLTSLLCTFALGFAACERQEPPRTARSEPSPSPQSAPAYVPGERSDQRIATADPGERESASPSSGAAVTPNALGIPAAPLDASKGPSASATASDAATTERTPDVVYVPTPQAVVDRMLKMAQVKKTDVVYDLGCGDGRIVITAAQRYGARAYGYDIDPVRVTEAKANVKAAKLEDLVTIEQKDIFTLDLSPASVVTLYLLPKLNVRLIPQLEQLKPGSRIVSHDFNMEGVKPLQHVKLQPKGEPDEHAIYLWKTPLVRE
jgi:precorrin-6B methylase 2